MAGSVNKVILIGNLGRDPEVRSTQAGVKVAQISLATSQSWKDKATGERKEKTEWHRVVIFGPVAEIAEKYLRRGSKCCVEGCLETRKWQDKDGQDRYTTEVVVRQFGGHLTLLEGKGSGGNSPPPHQGDSRDADPRETTAGGGSDFPDDDIPF